jgi:hypothetical protein
MKGSLAAQAEGSRSLGEVLEGNKDKDGAPIVFTKEQLKKHRDKCLVARQKLHDAQAEWKSSLDAAEKAGIPRREFKDKLKELSNPLTDEYKANRNTIDEMLGDEPTFDFPTKH